MTMNTSNSHQRIRCVLQVGALSLLLAFLQHSRAADGFWRMASDLGMTGQTNWNYYIGNDAPEGAYMGWLWQGKTNLSGTVSLGRTLTPGTYYVMAKVIDYMGGGQIEVSLGDARGVAATDNNDWNKYWTIPAVLVLRQSTSNLAVNLIKTIEPASIQKYLLRGVYITTNANENVPMYGYDQIVDYTYPTVMDNSAPVKANLIPNGSFEAGLGNGWGFKAAGYERDFSMPALWVTNFSSGSAFHGSAALRIPVKGNLVSRVYQVKPNKRYTLSAWVRSPSSTGLGLGIYNLATPPPGCSNVVNLYDGSLRIGPTWTRVSISGVLLDYPNTDYQILISANADTYVDCIQLEEGDLSDFTPAAGVEVGFLSDKPGRILFADEPLALTLLAFNGQSQAWSGQVMYEIFDIFNAKVASGDLPLSVSSNSRTEASFPLPARRGIFRVVAWVKDIPNTLEEVTYAVVAPPRTEGLDETSLIGVHPNFLPFELAIHNRLGFKWGRAMSPESIFRWSKIEPVEGQIVWYDEKVDRAGQNGMSILGTIGTNDYWPAWANSNGLPNLDKWESFVERLVTHYKDRIKYWEIWNEPIYVFTPEFYAELLKRAALAIRRADPEAKIVGMGGVYERDWVVNVMNLLGANWRQYLDYVSTHLYPPNTDPSGGEAEPRAAEFKRRVIDAFGVEVWNTEVGVWDEGFYKTANSSFCPAGDQIWPYFDSERYFRGCYWEPERLLNNFLACVGNGFTKYFYYDSRIYVDPSYQKSHPTMLEYDDSIRSKGIAYAIAGSFLGHSQGRGSVLSNAFTCAYLFDEAGTATVAVWSRDKQPHAVRLSPADWRAYDMMGNEIRVVDSTIEFGRTPCYVRAASLPTASMGAAFAAGVILARADLQPPNLSIDEFPTGSVRDPEIRLRWLGIDETSIPSATAPNAVTYSYKLDARDSDWSAWIPATRVVYESLPSGSYTFSVRARDLAGNVSAIQSRVVTVQLPAEVSPARPGAPTGLKKLP